MGPGVEKAPTLLWPGLGQAALGEFRVCTGVPMQAAPGTVPDSFPGPSE